MWGVWGRFFRDSSFLGMTILGLHLMTYNVIRHFIYHLTFIIRLEVDLKPLPNFFLRDGRSLKPKCLMFNVQCLVNFRYCCFLGLKY